MNRKISENRAKRNLREFFETLKIVESKVSDAYDKVSFTMPLPGSLVNVTDRPVPSKVESDDDVDTESFLNSLKKYMNEK